MTYFFGFGAALRPNLYRHALGFGVSGSWLKPLDNATNGYALRVTLSVGDSTYKSRTHPKEGGRVSLRAGPILSEQGQGLKIGGTLSGFASGVQRLGPGHVIGGRLHLAALIGDFAKPEPFGIGGLGGVRAFAPFVGAGRYLGIAGVEWRHEYTRNINLNVFHAVWLTGIDGVMFVDAALVADTLNGLGASRALYTGAGYGLRFHYLVGGIYPMVLLCDVGVPVLTEGGIGPRGVAPLSVNLALEQAF